MLNFEQSHKIGRRSIVRAARVPQPTCNQMSRQNQYLAENGQQCLLWGKNGRIGKGAILLVPTPRLQS